MDVVTRLLPLGVRSGHTPGIWRGSLKSPWTCKCDECDV